MRWISFIQYLDELPVWSPTTTKLNSLWVSGLHIEPSQWKLPDSTLTAPVIFASSSVSSSVPATWQPLWQRDTARLWISPRKTFCSFNWRHAGQDNKITLPSFILSPRLLLVWPDHQPPFASVTPPHRPALSSSPNVSTEIALSKKKSPKLLQITRCSRKWTDEE